MDGDRETNRPIDRDRDRQRQTEIEIDILKHDGDAPRNHSIGIFIC